MNSLAITFALIGFAPAADPPAVPAPIDLTKSPDTVTVEIPGSAPGGEASGDLPPTWGGAETPDPTAPEAAAAAESALADVGLDDETLEAESATLAQPLDDTGNPAAVDAGERANASDPGALPPTSLPAATSAMPAPPQSGVAARRARRNKAPPRDLGWRLEAQFSAGINSIFHSSYHMFDEFDRKLTMTRVAVFADYSLGRRAFLGGGAAYRLGQTSSNDFLGDARTSLRIQDPAVYGRLTIVPVEGIDVYAILGAGPSIIDTTFNVTGASLGDAEQRAVTFVGDAVLGGMVYLPQKWLPRGGKSRVTAGLDLNLGYTLRGAVAVSPQPTLDEEPIATSTADFGRLRASGLAWNLGVFVRFQ